MEDQTMAAFGQPSEVDPVSGNTVPPGGTPEGVRDDIDAKLSEGEFVIPAHVVRFVGVTQLMQLIQAAEAGIQQMEQQGMTGQPVNPSQAQGDLPFDPATLETEDDGQSMGGASGPVGFSTGGLVQDERLGKAALTPAASQLPSVALYRDRTGFLRAIPMINGQPVGMVPKDAQLVSGGSTNTAGQQQQQQNQQRKPVDIGNNQRWNEQGYQEEMKTYDVNQLSGAEARQMLGGQRQISDVTNSTAGRVARSIAGMVPGLGQVMSLAASAQQPVTSALANRVLEEDYGMNRASFMDNVRGRTSAQGARVLGKPTDLLDQLDRGRESGGSNIGVAEHTRTAGKDGQPDTITVPSLDKFNEGWGFVTSNQEGENRDGGGYSQSDLSSADFGGISEQRDRDLGW